MNHRWLWVVVVGLALALAACEAKVEIKEEDKIAPPPPGPLTAFIQSVTPSTGNIAYDATLVVTFTREMNTVTTEAAVSIDPPIAGTMGWNGAFTELTLTPSQPLHASQTYTVTIDGTATDTGANAMGTPFGFGFTTRAPTLADGTFTGLVAMGGYKDFTFSLSAGRAFDITMTNLPDDVDLYVYDQTPPAVAASFDESFCIPFESGLVSEECVVSTVGSLLVLRADGSFMAGSSAEFTITIAESDYSGSTPQNAVPLLVDGAADTGTLAALEHKYFVVRALGDQFYNDITGFDSTFDIDHVSDWGSSFPVGSSPEGQLCNTWGNGIAETCSWHIIGPTGGHSLLIDVYEFNSQATSYSIEVMSTPWP